MSQLPKVHSKTKSKTNTRVVISKDGPYMVTGNVPLSKQIIVANARGESESWKEGEKFSLQETYALCRCGESKKKPFCDGTHSKIGFDGTETASRDPYLDQAKVLNGPAMQLTDVEDLCAFGRFCDSKGSIWAQVENTDDPNVKAAFIKEANNCPSGRLIAWDKATGKSVESKLPVSIGLVEDPLQDCSGPLWLRGGITLVSADGFEYEVRNHMTVCRCGQSQNKPFCDGTHASMKFHDD